MALRCHWGQGAKLVTKWLVGCSYTQTGRSERNGSWSKAKEKEKKKLQLHRQNKKADGGSRNADT